MNPRSIRPFVPSKDFELSKAFYATLGFHVEPAGDQLAICTLGSCTFFLQKYYNEVFANNLMMQLVVDDIELAHATLSKAPLHQLKYTPVKHEAWGKVVYLWGPVGELWHITELNSDRH